MFVGVSLRCVNWPLKQRTSATASETENSNASLQKTHSVPLHQDLLPKQLSEIKLNHNHYKHQSVILQHTDIKTDANRKINIFFYSDFTFTNKDSIHWIISKHYP